MYWLMRYVFNTNKCDETAVAQHGYSEATIEIQTGLNSD